MLILRLGEVGEDYATVGNIFHNQIQSGKAVSQRKKIKVLAY